MDRSKAGLHCGKETTTFTAAGMAIFAVLVFGVSGSTLRAQDGRDQGAPSVRPEFEVASVKAVNGVPDAKGRLRCPDSFKVDRGRVDITCLSTAGLIAHAFQISPDRVVGPDWLSGPGSQKFDVEAKIPQGTSAIQVPEMLQALLSERFKLSVHRGTANRDVYALVVAKGGSRMRRVPAEASGGVAPRSEDGPTAIELFGGVETARKTVTRSADGRSSTTTISNPRMGAVIETDGPDLFQRWEAPSTTLEGLVSLLDRVTPLSMPVVNMTGLEGRYHVLLEVTLKDVVGGERNIADDPSGRERALAELDEMTLRAFNDGLRKLGLQLERRKAHIGILIVDHVEKLPTGN
jgi:uncharacterized protein (TIGR03435 family)